MSDLRNDVAFAIEQATPTDVLSKLYANPDRNCYPMADAAIAAVIDALIAKAELDPSLHVVSMLTPQHGVFLSDWLRDHRQPPDDPDDD